MTWSTGEPDMLAELECGELEDLLEGLRRGGVRVVDEGTARIARALHQTEPPSGS
jgi:hypothetical protein